jgi:hypothetical protein
MNKKPPFSKTYTRKGIKKYVKDYLKPGVTVFVTRSSSVNNCGLVQKMWTVFVWKFGTARCNGVKVEAIDYHDAIENTIDAIVDYQPTWLLYYHSKKL